MAKKTILITGCSLGGIGDSLAQEFHRKGLRVFATARSMSKIAHLQELGIETLPLDVTSTKSIAEAVSKISALTGGELDYLFNNSGAGYSMPVLDVDIEAAKQMFDVNFFALITVTKAFIPLLIKAHGTVVNNTSIVANLPLPFAGIYCASKAAASSLNSIMRLEFKGLGVKVVEVRTGTVKTRFFDNANNGQEQSIPENSYYLRAKQEVELAMAGKEMDEKSMMDVDVYAKKVVGDLLPGGSSHVIWRGGSSSIARFMATFATVGMLDYVSGMSAGLTSVEKKLKHGEITSVKH